MTSSAIRLSILVLALAVSAAAHGQTRDWYVAPAIIWNDDDEFRALDDSVSGAQVAVGKHFHRNFSLEGMLGYSAINAFCEPGDCYPNQTHVDASANLLAFYNRDAAAAPYLLVGVGLLRTNADTGMQFVRNTGTDASASASIGAGIVWKLGQSNYAIRTEYRSRVSFTDPSNLNDKLLTVGLQFAFGNQITDPGTPDSNKDSDGDGVLDIWDACDNTPPGVNVSSRGCRIENISDDDDDDNIRNSLDACPNTPAGVPVDRSGCSLDSDMDGVTSDLDRCPATRPGAEVNVYGCENDEDQDGVPNHRDSCPDTRPDVRIDIVGCEIEDIISLPGLNFQTGVDTLVPGTEYLMQAAADTLNLHPDLMIEVAGHTDNVGDQNQNQGLSMRRAMTVRHFLIQYGVDEERLTFRGYGDTQPIADNETTEGKAANRRVELRLVNQ